MQRRTFALILPFATADLRRQGDVLAEALRRAGVPTSTTVVPGSSHTRIILTLSRDDTVSARAILKVVAGVAPGHATRGS